MPSQLASQLEDLLKPLLKSKGPSDAGPWLEMYVRSLLVKGVAEGQREQGYVRRYRVRALGISVDQST